MYFVDPRKIEKTLSYIETCLATFEAQRSWQRPIEKFALERMAHVLIEAVIDTGNEMIDGFIMRDPGSYADVIDILCDEKVIPDGDGRALKELIEGRKALVRSYVSIEHHWIERLLQQSLPALRAFPAAVRRYLNEELGPVSAFLPENQQGHRDE